MVLPESDWYINHAADGTPIMTVVVIFVADGITTCFYMADVIAIMADGRAI